MDIQDKAAKLTRKLKLDSHHGIERFGVFFSIFVVTGVLILVSSGFSAYRAAQDRLADTALYTPSFTTSKTGVDGEVDGVFTNQARNKALVLMHFADGAAMSSQAADYKAFLLGSNTDLVTKPLNTPGITGSFQIFGSTGYVAVLLEASEPFQRQILNLTLRAKAELSSADPEAGGSGDDLANDASFAKYDQWRVFINPGASQATHLPALDSVDFDPVQAFYEVIVAEEEHAVRGRLDAQLAQMRAALTRVDSYTTDLQTTKVDGLFLKQPAAPPLIAGDRVTGETAAESDTGESTLTLETATVAPGGFDLDWRAGSVLEGYLDELVPNDQNYATYLSLKAQESGQADSANALIGLQWTLSDGTSLLEDYSNSDVTMQPLITLMNNLSQAYSDYLIAKKSYQGDLTLELLALDVDLRDVASNSSTESADDFLTTYY